MCNTRFRNALLFAATLTLVLATVEAQAGTNGCSDGESLAIDRTTNQLINFGQSQDSDDQTKTDQRPNILFAFADDWGRYASAYAKLEPGGPSDLIDTPNFDRVAAEGVLFRNAFVNSPSCTPCRSSILSGQYFWRTRLGAILRGARWDNSIPSYPLILKDRGYHIGFTYKVWSPGRPADAPYGGKPNGYHQAGRKFNRFSQQVSAAKDKQKAKQRLLDEVDQNFAAFLKDRPAGQPFCYWFGPTNCHRDWVAGSGKAIWGLDPDDLKGKAPPFVPDVEVVRQDMCDYLGEAQAFDAALGVLLKRLEATGQLDNTIVVVSGDHGIPGFPHGKCNLYDFGVAVPLAVRWPRRAPGGRVVDDFVNLMDLAPTFLEAAGEEPPPIMTGRSFLDVLSSDQARQVDPKRDYVVTGRERHVESARPGNLPYPHRAIRTKDFLYIRNFKPDRWPNGWAPGYGGAPATDEPLDVNARSVMSDFDRGPTKTWFLNHLGDASQKKYIDWAFSKRPAEELYDLKKDPHQIHNVAQDPRYAQQREELSERLMAILRETNDPRVTGAGDTFDKPPYTSGLRGG